MTRTIHHYIYAQSKGIYSLNAYALCGHEINVFVIKCKMWDILWQYIGIIIITWTSVENRIHQILAVMALCHMIQAIYAICLELYVYYDGRLYCYSIVIEVMKM